VEVKIVVYAELNFHKTIIQEGSKTKITRTKEETDFGDLD
jgi:hypothetical protein